jgi:hypothetical protein
MMQSGAYDNVERRLAEYFGQTAREAPLSDGFWPRLRTRLALLTPEGPSLWQRLTARRWAVASTAAVLALAIVLAAAAAALLGDGDSVAILSGIVDDEDGESGARGPGGAAGSAEPGDDSNVLTFITTTNESRINGLGNSTVDKDDDPFLIQRNFAATGVGGDAFDAFYDAGAEPTTTDTPSPLPAAEGQAQIDTSGRTIISTTSLAIEVEAVAIALAQMRVIAESAGGFIETLSTSGGADPERGNATIRVPGNAFFDAMTRIKALGEVTGELVGSNDVTEDIIDLAARLRSEEAKEVRFLVLLDDTTSVSEVLSVERELSRVRTDIERLQGQLSFIERRVSLATINVNFGKPGVSLAEAPSASLAIRTKHVDDAVADVKRLVEQAGGEVDHTSVSQGDDGIQASVTLRVPPANFDGVLLQLQQLGDVRAKEVRQPEATTDEPQSEDAVARIDVTLSSPPDGEDDRNWWLWAGASLGGVAALVVLIAGARLAFVVGRRSGDAS